MKPDDENRSFCRTCLVPTTRMYSLLENNLLKLLKECASVQVDDNGPKHICYECKDFLIKYDSFRCKCLEVERLIVEADRKVSSFDEPKAETLEPQVPTDPSLDVNTEDNNNMVEFESSECANSVGDIPSSEQIVQNRKKRKKSEDDGTTHRMECYQCDYCHETFSYKNHLRDHLSIHVEKKTFQCYICLKNYVGLGSLTRHYNSWHATDERKVHCTACNEAFYVNEQLKLHTNEVHAKPKCSECCQTFDKLKQLRVHLVNAHGENIPRFTRRNHMKKVGAKRAEHTASLACLDDECPMKFRSLSTLSSHIVKCHTDLKASFKCDKCDDAFFVKSQLDKHIVRVHRDIKCEHCSKRMKSVRNLNRHVTTVHAVKIPLCCPECNKVCYTDETYKRHRNSHKNVDLRKICNYCGLKFIKLEQHVTNIHKIARDCRKFTCRFCALKFDDMPTLRNHSKRMHVVERGNEIRDAQCKICEKKFLKRDLSNHMKRTHTHARPYECTFCDKTYKEKQHYKRHVTLHTSGSPYACEFCDKKYRHAESLRKHRLIHVECPLECHTCAIEFKNRDDMNEHMVMHETGELITGY